MKRIVNGILYVLFIGALMLGSLTWTALLFGGPWYMSVIFGIMALASFVVGYLSEGGGADRTDEDTRAA